MGKCLEKHHEGDSLVPKPGDFQSRQWGYGEVWEGQMVWKLSDVACIWTSGCMHKGVRH